MVTGNLFVEQSLFFAQSGAQSSCGKNRKMKSRVKRAGPARPGEELVEMDRFKSCKRHQIDIRIEVGLCSSDFFCCSLHFPDLSHEIGTSCQKIRRELRRQRKRLMVVEPHERELFFAIRTFSHENSQKMLIDRCRCF